MSQRNPTDLECTEYAVGIVALGMSKSDAFLKSFPQSTMSGEALHTAAYQFSNLPQVCLRISDMHKSINDKANEDALFTADQALRELDEARNIAAGEVDDAGKRGFSNPSAMVSATMGKAKIAGLLVDKVAQVEAPQIIINRPTKLSGD